MAQSNMQPQTEGRQREEKGFKLWFGVFGAAAAWFTHLNLAYILAGVMCSMGGEVLLYVISAVLALIALASGVSSWSIWKEMSVEERGSLIGRMEGTRYGFMVYAGMLTSGVFLLAILMATIPIIFLNPCEPSPRF